MALYLKKNDVPTKWNKEALLGGLAGWILGGITVSIGGFALASGSALVSVAGAALGGYIGGSMGEQRMEQERTVGKLIEEPTRWNKEAAIGGLIGFLGAGLVAIAGVLAGGITGGLTGSAAGAVAGAVPEGGVIGLGIGAVAGMLAGLVVSPPLGAYIGGGIGKRKMEEESKEAQAAAMQAIQSPQRAYTVSPEEAQLLEARLAQGKHTERAQGQQNAPAVLGT